MSSRAPELLIQDMIESAQKIFEYTDGLSFDEFCADKKTIDAVVRNFEIIEKATSRLPETFRKQQTQIDWQRIRGFRNRIVHEYFGIDLSILWRIKETYLSQLLDDLQNTDTGK